MPTPPLPEIPARHSHWLLDPMVSVLPLAVVIGVVGALVVESFRLAMDGLLHLYSSQSHLVAAAAAIPPWARVLVPTLEATAAGLTMWLGQRWLRRPRGPEYMEAVRVGDGELPVAPNLVRTGSSLLAVSGGITIGREGTMIQLAALVASLAGRLPRARAEHRRLTVACGAAAGFAAAYHAPIAGTLFVAEIILGGLQLRAMAPVLVAAVMGELTTQTLFAGGALYMAQAVPPLGFAEVLAGSLIGVAAGLIGPAFLWLLDAARHRTQALVRWLPLRFALAGLVIGLLSAVRPEVWGNGFSTVQALLQDPWVPGVLALVTLLRLLAVTTASAAGIPGGVLTPTLALGGAMGLLLMHALPLGSAGPQADTLWTLVGMGSLLAATTHAPAMSAIMMFEITRDYNVVLATLPACVLASVLGSLLRPRSVYDEALGLKPGGGGEADEPADEARPGPGKT